MRDELTELHDLRGQVLHSPAEHQKLLTQGGGKECDVEKMEGQPGAQFK